MLHMTKQNARLRVLLKHYMEKDDSLISSSQLSPERKKAGIMRAAATASSCASSSSSSSLLLSEDPLLASPPSCPLSDVTTTEDDDELAQLSQITEIGTFSQLDDMMSFLDRQEKIEPLDASDSRSAQVRVGVGVILTCPTRHQNTAILMGKRLGSHGANTLALPGGHLELGESWEACAIREVEEETALKLKTVEFAHVTNDYMEAEGKHYITIFMRATIPDPTLVKNMEPHKCQGWDWYEWGAVKQLQDQLFLPMRHLLETYTI